MTGDEVGVEMRQKYVLDRQAMLAGDGEVLLDVALRIDDGGGFCVFVADEIRRMREAVQVELGAGSCERRFVQRQELAPGALGVRLVVDRLAVLHRHVRHAPAVQCAG